MSQPGNAAGPRRHSNSGELQASELAAKPSSASSRTAATYRSDSTRPRSTLLAQQAGANAASGGSRPGLAGTAAVSASGTTRTARTSGIGAGSSGSRPSSAGSAAGVDSSAATAAPGLAAAAGSGSRHPGTAGATASNGSSILAPIITSSAAGSSSRTSITPGLSLQSNALFNQETSMTPTVRRQQYTPSLSPDLQQLEEIAKAAGIPLDDLELSNGGIDTRYDHPIQHQQQQQPHQQQQQQSRVHPGPLAAAKAPAKHFLRTTGDLFYLPDQETAQESLEVAVAGTQLVSPGWNQSRPWLTGSWIMAVPPDFITEAGGSGSPCEPLIPALRELSLLPPAEQELALVDDLLSVFMGQAGQHIRHETLEGPKWQRLGFRVEGLRDASLLEQVERLLPLCEYGHVIKRFIETRTRIEHPTVVQALAAKLCELYEQWWLLVIQLEHQLHLGQLNLAALIYYCQAPAASLELLASIAGEAADQPNLTSAGLLNLLAARQRSLAGDRPGQLLLGQLLEAAAEPYFAIMRQWLCWGVLDDPYNEFMVKEHADVGRDSMTPEGDPAYWSRRYRLRGAVTDSSSGSAYDVPDFLASSAEAILITGKYLNVIRQCGQPVPPCPESTSAKLTYSAAAAESGSPAFLGGIQEALAAAAGALLGLMTGPQCRLLSWLHCLKHIFLLNQGDMLVHLLEAAEADLSQPPAALPAHQLQGLLDAALRSSSVAASPHIDVLGEGALSAVMDRRSLIQLVTAAKGGAMGQDGASLQPSGCSSMSGWQMLLLSVRLSWPLTLVVARRQLLHYQVLFKHLLALKYAERQLGQVWQGMRATKRLSREDQLLFRPWHLLCSQLQYVVGEVLRFTTIDVLEPLWGDMQARLARAGNMDEVIALHNAFLAAALERALLTQMDVVKRVNSLLAAAAELAQQAAGLTDTAAAAAGNRGGGAAGLGSSSSSNGRGKVATPAVDNLKVMSMFCRDGARQMQLANLQSQVEDDLQRLVLQLNSHYEGLLQPGAASGAAGLMQQGGSRGLGSAGSSSSGIGDSSRDLASLHNLIQRLDWGSRLTRSEQQLWPAAY